MDILKTTNLRKYYGSGDTVVKALDGVNLSVADGEFAAIVGTSGSGKSTLLHMLGGLDRPTDGTVEVEGHNIFSLKDDSLTIFRRRKIGFVFQSYNLVPVLNVYENIHQARRHQDRHPPHRKHHGDARSHRESQQPAKPALGRTAAACRDRPRTCVETRHHFSR